MMIFQFSLYGFFKNLRFFEAFFLLFLREKGLSFTEIGVLFASKEILVNIFNIPTGAIADIYGRKKSLIFGFVAYLFSFLLFSYAESFANLYVAILLFGIGESFRAGTHKAMIFDYLREKGRLNEKTLIYGFTRSWSQAGSAISVLIGGLIVYLGSGHKNIFLYSCIPCILGIINIASYPNCLDKKNETGHSLKEIFLHLVRTTKKCWNSLGLRHLILQSTLYEGQFRAVKDYLQILISMFALSLPFFTNLPNEKRTAVLISLIYFCLYLLSSFASRNSNRVLKLFKSEEKAIRAIMLITGIFLMICALGALTKTFLLAIIFLVFIFNLQNIMRPIMTARYDDLSKSEEQATILSVESQANSIGVFFLSPLFGYFADHYSVGYSFIFSALLLLGYLFFSRTLKKTLEKNNTANS